MARAIGAVTLIAAWPVAVILLANETVSGLGGGIIGAWLTITGVFVYVSEAK